MATIRYLTASDRTAVLRINAESRPGVAALDESEFARLMALPHHHLAAESINRSLVGYVLAFASEAPYDGEEFQLIRRREPRPFIYIDQVATRRGSRRTGIGSTLYDALENVARLTGSPLLCCEVNIDPPNPDSMTFHQDREFEEIGDLETSDGRTVVLLRKDIQ